MKRALTRFCVFTASILLVEISCSASQVLIWGGAAAAYTNIPPDLTNAVALAAGSTHFVALRDNGTIAVWGQNNAGQTNTPAGLTNIVAIAAGDRHSLALRNDGQVIAWGSNSSGQTNVPAGLTNVATITASLSYSVALRTDGTIVAWGANGSGQTNVPSGLTNAVAVDACLNFCMALTADGRVVSWGSNNSVFGTETNGVALAGNEAPSTFRAVLLKSDSTVKYFGTLPGPPAGLSNVVAAANGADFSLALKSDGTLVSWGSISLPSGLTNLTAIAGAQSQGLALRGSGIPFFTEALINRTAAAERPIALRTFATGEWPIFYQWQHAGTNLPWGTNSVLTLTNVTANEAGIYSVVASNVIGVTTLSNMTLALAPALIITQPKNQRVLLNSSATFTVSAIGPQGMSYQWRFNGATLPGATNATLVLTNIQLGQAGLYSVILSNQYGSVASDDATLEITQVATWGDNSKGQLNLPSGLTNLVTISSGFNHMIALRRDNTLVAWGGNTFQQTNVPPGLSNVVAVAAAYYHNVILKADGTVFCWGDNSRGQLNLPSDATNVVAVAGGTYHSLALKSDGTVIAWGNGMTVLSGLSNVVVIAGGGNHSLALKADGSVIAWGNNNTYGQCTVPSNLTSVVSIAAGDSHNLALKSDGSVVAWGAGNFVSLSAPHFGQSIVPTNLGEVMSISARGYNSLVATVNGEVRAWGQNNKGQTSVPAGLPAVSSVSAAIENSTVLIGDGPPFIISPSLNRTTSYYGMTYFRASAVGSVPLSYQWKHFGTNIPGATNATFVLSNSLPGDAGIYAVVVSNLFGAATNSDMMLAVVPAIDVRPSSQITFVGSPVVLSNTLNSSLPLSYQWQFNGTDLPNATNSGLIITNVQLRQAGSYSLTVDGPAGVAQSSPAVVFVTEVAAWDADSQSSVSPALTNVIAVAGGIFHSMVLNADGTVSAWGFGNYVANDFGQAAVPAALTNVAAITAGEFHSLALKVDGTVKGWGYNNFGQATPPLDLTNTVGIAAGSGHSIGLRSEGHVVAWGANAYGQLSIPTNLSNVVAVSASGDSSFALKSDGTIAGWGATLSGQIPPGLSNVVAISSGEDHCLALQANGSVVAWGADSAADLPPGLSNVVAIAAGTGRNLALKSDGSVVVWPNLSVPAGLANVRSIASGYYHNLAVLGDIPPNFKVQLLNPAKTASFSVTIQTQSGKVYLLEYKNSLEEPNWTPLPLVAGNGGLKVLTDSTGTNSQQRFYRVRQW